MAVTIEQIKNLREATGVSMTSCKSALEEANGDFDKAVDVLRKKGEAKAAARADRTTKEGAISAKIEGKKAFMVQVGCETDFVSVGDEFVALVEKVLGKLVKGEIKSEDRDVPEVKEFGMKTGEKVQVMNMAEISGDVLGMYIHPNKKIGVLVSMEGGNADLLKDVCMQVAATDPKVISPDEIGQDLVDKEKEIWSDQLKKEGKPEAIVEKIMMGKEKKFREENALLKQPFIKDPNKNIEALLGGAKVLKFVRFAF